MEDIEDLFKNGIDADMGGSRNLIMPKVRNRKVKKIETINGDVEIPDKPEMGSFVPGTQKVYVKTWGCSHNSSDSEYMMGILASNGYKIVDDKLDADLWLLNSCTVKSPAEEHFKNEIKAGQLSGKLIVVAGCVPQGGQKVNFLKGISSIGVQQIDRVVEVVEETLKGNSVQLFGPKRVAGKKTGGASLSLPKVRRNPLIEIISISTGCLNQCSYCKTKHARGQLGSYPIDEIVTRAVQSFQEGVCEIWLTSEDTGAYGRDIGADLPMLLDELVKVIPENCRLRLGMTNPPYILDHLVDMARILSHPRVYSFLHVPVQSGSDYVLGDMKREYTVDDFCKVVDYLRDKVPGITIATDIICGYPTETEEDFNDTVKLCQKYKFPSLFINQFYPRPGTPAAKLPRIPTQDVKQRSRRLTEFFTSYSTYDHKMSENQSILVTEESHDKEHWVGHNKFYEQVLLPKSEKILGKLVDVKIVQIGKHYLKGELISNSVKSPGLTDPLPKGMISGITLKKSFRRQENLIVLSFIAMICILLLRLYFIFTDIYNDGYL